MNQKLSSSEEKHILDIQGTSSFSILQSIQLKFQMESNSCPLPHSPRFSIPNHFSGTLKFTIHISRCPRCPAKTECVFPHNPRVKTRKKTPQFFLPLKYPIKGGSSIFHTSHIQHISQSSPTARSGLQYLFCRPCPLSSKCSEKPRPIPAALFLLQCILRASALWHFQPKHFREIMICSVTNQQRPKSKAET